MGSTECDRTRARISFELDGELSRHEAALLERHLSRCAECALYAEDVRGLTNLLRAAPLEQPPPFALPRRASAMRLSVRIGAAVGSTAAAALVAVSMLSFGKPAGNHAQAVPLVFFPTGVAAKRVGGGPLGLRHPSAPSADEHVGLLDSPRHDQVGS